jgi:hypothetical protein
LVRNNLNHALFDNTRAGTAQLASVDRSAIFCCIAATPAGKMLRPPLLMVDTDQAAAVVKMLVMPL